jgi:prepilin-type N-terminal cleavage/methylation domain-containing protein
MNTEGRKREQGFTLIEIIAVLIILAILSAVAVPKFLDLRDQAQIKGLEGLVSAAQSQLHLVYAENILIKNGNATAAWKQTQSDVDSICEDVSADGWLEDAGLECNGDGNPITITATYEGQTATGNFTNPNPNSD